MKVRDWLYWRVWRRISRVFVVMFRDYVRNYQLDKAETYASEARERATANEKTIEFILGQIKFLREENNEVRKIIGGMK
jgi:hypothetical protein